MSEDFNYLLKIMVNFFPEKNSAEILTLFCIQNLFNSSVTARVEISQNVDIRAKVHVYI